jgi:hypothetical protein
LIPETMAQAVAIAKRVNASWPRPDALPATPEPVADPQVPTVLDAVSTPKLFSPAAQAVKSAAEEAFWDWDNAQPRDPQEIAAALIRRLVILHGKPTPGGSVILSGDDLLAIATELEGHHG